MIYIQIGTI